MKKLILSLLATVLSILPLAAQESNFNYKAVEAKIKKYIFSSPDSTRHYIKYALAQKNLPDSLRGTVYNIYGIYYGNVGKTDSSIHYYKKAISTLKNNPRIRTMPLMNISVAFRNKAEYATSFQYLEEALELSKKLNLRQFEATVYSNMSSNYQFMLEYDKAIDCLLKGIAILKKEDDKSNLVNMNQKLANTYMKMRNFAFAKDMYTECIAIFKANGDKINHALTLINLAECVKHLGELDSAKKALKEAITELQVVKNSEHLAIAYTKLGSIAYYENKYDISYTNYKQAYAILLKENSLNVTVIAAEFTELLNKMGKYDEALTVIEAAKKSAFFKNVNTEDKMRFDMAAAETYKNTDKHEEALEGITSAIKLQDTMADINNNDYVNVLQAKFQKELQQEKNITLKAKNNSLQKEKEAKAKLTMLYTFAVALLIVIVLIMLRSYWLKSRLQKEELKNLSSEKNLLEQQNRHEHEITNAQKEIIEEKQRELTSTALRMADYQNNINEIIEKCEHNNFNSISELKKELLAVSRQKDYWRQFETRFNSLHPDFGINLTSKFSNLTKNDIEFCSLLKLNLSNKEIASLLQISHESAITKKYRIKKKMEIHDDAAFEKLLTEI